MKTLINKLCLLLSLMLLSGCLPNSSGNNGQSDTAVTDTSSINIPDTAIQSISHPTKLDSARIKALKKGFKVTKDEFDVDQRQWIRPINEPRYVNRNGIYSYFQTTNGVATNLRFVIQYYSDDWLFIERYQFSIDGKAYEYAPTKVETDHGDGMIWEWFDDPVDANLKEILEAIVKSKSCKIKMVGSQYFDLKNVSVKQKESIRKTLELYRLMGGT